jgi:ABC-type dipeptide/oligopeptide/nickel transport system permease subunit
LDLRGVDRINLSARSSPTCCRCRTPLPELRRVNAAPSLHHFFGTDDLGRDIFARIVYGSRVSIEVSLGAMLIGFGSARRWACWPPTDEASSTRS